MCPMHHFDSKLYQPFFLLVCVVFAFQICILLQNKKSIELLPSIPFNKSKNVSYIDKGIFY